MKKVHIGILLLCVFSVFIWFIISVFVSIDICPSSIMAANRNQGPILAQSDNFSGVPGVVIDYSPAETEKYIGSPSIAVLPNGYYIASHDFFGPGSKNNRTVVFRSKDSGKTWQHLTDINLV